MPENNRDRDLVLAPGEQALILDETKGQVIVWVGPAKASLSATDRPVKFDKGTRRFVETPRLEESKEASPFAVKGWYIVLHNPASNNDEELQHPVKGTSSIQPKLQYGKKINVEGPATFALFPGQVAEPIEGHRLKTNQYLVVRVYDEEAAKENWGKTTIKFQQGEEFEIEEKLATPDLTMGKLFIIEGTKVSFYIPPTGIEVVPEDKRFVRDAVTLERLEYCILLDEDGNKRYVTGPDVVFPSPTEVFIEKDKTVKFRAIELNELMGLYIKVIADYEEDGNKYKAGDELFITGNEQRIYYPRPEHAIVRYGKKQRIYSLAIPEGEARYVLNRMTGEVFLKRGPCMFLPDPRKEVTVRRVLDERQAGLWFPNNKEALKYNSNLELLNVGEANKKFVAETRYVASMAVQQPMKRSLAPEFDTRDYDTVVSDEMERGTSFTPPRTITLDTKYEGAVTIDVWPGYAVQVVSKTGERKVVVGPQVHLLEYDETLESLNLSTGTPKVEGKLLKTVYLRVLHNTISDLVTVETSDFCEVKVKVSYRVDFEGDPSKWFNVENYVKFLTDHLRSLLRNRVKKSGIREFYGNHVDIIRDTILDVKREQGDGERLGRVFTENGMRVYDIEVLAVSINDPNMRDTLIDSEQERIRQEIFLNNKEMELERTSVIEEYQRGINKQHSLTLREKAILEQKEIEERLLVNLGQQKANLEVAKATDAVGISQKESAKVVAEIANLIQREKNNVALSELDAKMKLKIKELNADSDAIVQKAGAISPQLISALQNFADKELVGKLAANFNVLSILGGKSILEVASNLLGETDLGDVLKNMHLHMDAPKIAKK